ncbi:hypothetical protein [Anatilimnocola floriformis]|uniref:hypothetical protein n=1 Tax=Anatilimnocola floriformis TaxID=2948575 RepID=UPI0020C591DF|nr:hypothetical protein [Anatilimnocola floriformis]
MSSSPTADPATIMARIAVWVIAFGFFFFMTSYALNRRDQIASYTTPKPESIATAVASPGFPPGGMPPQRVPSKPPPSEDLKFETPAEWKQTAGNQFSLKAFEVVDGSEKVDITVSLTGGELIANMNRWRGQVGLPEFKQEELAEALKPREVNGMSAMFIEMHSPESAPTKKSILGVLVPDGDRTWFIKLIGSTKLAEQERQRFEEFAKSLSW